MTSSRRQRAADIAAHGFFLFLLIFDVVRTLRHAMWRDEMEIYLVATSPPGELFTRLNYEAHPALWYALSVWGIVAHRYALGGAMLGFVALALTALFVHGLILNATIHAATPEGFPNFTSED